MTLEILFYYESRQNPNGDPGFENQPRLMGDETIMVTDVRIKRTMRDYARDVKGQKLFVDFSDDGGPIKADERAKEIIGSLEGDVIKGLLEKTFDVPLFGALVTIRGKNEDKGDSAKLTGPLQFGNAKSVNMVTVINPSITSKFVGATEKFSTIGKFYSVEYALIKVQGTLNPKNLVQYADDNVIMKKFEEKVGMIHDCLWNGTNGLVTRSKYPQRSILYIDVDYKGKIYNDLPRLVSENESLKGMASSLGDSPFDFTKLISVLTKRKEEINEVRVCGAEDVDDDVNNLITSLIENGVKANRLSN